MSQMNNNEAIMLYNRSLDFVEVRADAERFPRLADIPELEAYNQVKGMVVGAAILRNAPMTDENVELTAGAFLQEVRQDFPGITLQEIGLAIRNGCFEKYGQVYGLSAVALYKMVQGYTESSQAEEYRKAAIARKNGQMERVKKWVEEHPGLYKKP